MTGFLLDTNVLSVFSRSDVPPHPRVKRWVELVPPDILFTSVLTFGEIRKGIELLAPGKKRTELERWLDADLREWFGTRLLPITHAISNRWVCLLPRPRNWAGLWKLSMACWLRLPLSTV